MNAAGHKLEEVEIVQVITITNPGIGWPYQGGQQGFGQQGFGQPGFGMQPGFGG